MSNFSPMYFEQPIVIFDTTETLSSTTGAFVLYGGLSVNSTYESSNISSGSFVLKGGMGVQKNINVGGNTNIAGVTHVTNSTQSTGVGNGALVVNGGVGIAKDLFVGGSATISGNLFVNGTTTSVNTTTVNITDNTLMLNAGPGGSRDSGVLIERFQTDNDVGDGDVIHTTEPIVQTIAVDSATSTNITFAVANVTPDYYKHMWIKISSGAGNNQVRKVTAYNNGTYTITLSSALTTIPSNGDFVQFYNRNYIAQYYKESTDEFILGYVSDALDIKEQLASSGYLNTRVQGLWATNSTITNLVATNFTAGAIAMTNAVIENATIGSARLGTITTGTLAVTGASLLRGGVTAGSLNVTGN